MYKSILAATALALAASAVPAAAYEHDSKYQKSYSKTYSNRDGGRREHADGRWEHRSWRHRHDDDYGYRHHRHRRHWWQRFYGWNRY